MIVPSSISTLFTAACSPNLTSVRIPYHTASCIFIHKCHTAAPPPESGISLSPPFVMSIAMSSSGTIATGTADGRIWIGTGGDKRLGAGAKKKRSRKWEGLREEEGLSVKVAEGPVVGLYGFFATLGSRAVS